MALDEDLIGGNEDNNDDENNSGNNENKPNSLIPPLGPIDPPKKEDPDPNNPGSENNG